MEILPLYKVSYRISVSWISCLDDGQISNWPDILSSVRLVAGFPGDRIYGLGARSVTKFSVSWISYQMVIDRYKNFQYLVLV